MKHDFFEILLNLVAKTLMQLQQTSTPQKRESDGVNDTALPISDATTIPGIVRRLVIQSAKPDSMRVLTDHEIMKLTKPSYQFLMQMRSLGVIDADDLECVLARLMFSDSPFISVNEVKWAIRHSLSEKLNPLQVAFLDLVLYQRENGFLLQ